MPGSFVFASEFTTENFLSQTQLSKGTGNGIDNPNRFHALGGAFTFDDNAANIVSVALLPGQTMNLDVDFGLSNNVDTINTEIRVIDALGKEVAFNDTAAGADVGSPTTGDPTCLSRREPAGSTMLSSPKEPTTTSTEPSASTKAAPILEYSSSTSRLPA